MTRFFVGVLCGLFMGAMLSESPRPIAPMIATAPAAKEAGPSRERLVVLLHECRVANREHLRMLQEYDAREAKRSEPRVENLPDGGTRTFDGCNWTTCRGSLCERTLMYCGPAPEQVFGGVEFGLGGH